MKKSLVVQYAKATNPGTLPRKFEELSHSHSRIVRLGLVENESIPTVVLRQVVRTEKNPRVLKAARRALESREEASASQES